ncbi:MAG: sulfatase [Bacteroidota bacterium]|nr:sulfatase [Bacteroidota bacterium]
MKKIICLLTTSLAFSVSGLFAQQAKKPNVLFIAVDDLNTVLGCYGNKMIKTPNIDRLAKMGTVFTMNYCQQSVCGPTRASLMTGRRPDYTKVWDLRTKMRDINPGIVTLPQYFKSNGYSTAGVGKIYHPTCVEKFDNEFSWTVPYLKPKATDYAIGFDEPAEGHYQSTAIKTAIANKKIEKKVEDQTGETGGGKLGPSSESIDVPDNAYEDGVSALLAKAQIIKFSKEGNPFFMAVGIKKPHLPFVAPKKYWNLYKREDMPLATFQEHSKNGPLIAYHSSGELRNYTDIPAFATLPADSNRIGLKIDKQKELIHGYYAAVSYADAQVGLLLNTLDSLGILNNTVIVLWGDHGWHLGDHDLWQKHTNFEQATRAPLIFAAPGIKPGQSSSLTEHVDIFPTLCNLTGLPVPTYLAGKSLVPVMKNNKATVKEFAISQYHRTLNKDEAKRLGLKERKLWGYAMRTDKYRYVMWLNNNFHSDQAFSADRIYAIELYDYTKDPLEKVNVAKDKKYATVSKELYNKMIAFFKSQEKTLKSL